MRFRFLACGWLTAACSTATVVVDAGTDASADFDGGSVDSGAVDAGLDGVSDAAIVADAGNVGRVFAISDSVVADGGTKSSYRVGAYFVHREGAETATTTKPVGPCVVEIFTGQSTVVEKDRAAGTIAIVSGGQTVSLIPAGKIYDAKTGNVALWKGGDSVSASASGSTDVPAFSVSLTAPSILTVTAPALPSAPAGSLAVTRSADLSASWTGTSSGDVVLYFDVTDGAKAYATTCTFSAKDGKGTIPAAAFADLPKGAGTFNFYVKTAANAPAADWSIKFIASSAMLNGAGGSATGTAEFK